VGWRGTLILAAALLVAGVVLYVELIADSSDFSLQSVVRGPRDAPPADQVTRLLSFDPQTVTAVRLRRGEAEWRAVRDDGSWSGTGSPGDIDDFLDNLLQLAEIIALEVPQAELADHGLNPPAASVELERRGAPPVILLLGGRNPPSTGVYAQVGPGGRVVLTGALALWDFDKAVRAFSPTAVP
jgi:hypothetical protein